MANTAALALDTGVTVRPFHGQWVLELARPVDAARLAHAWRLNRPIVREDGHLEEEWSLLVMDDTSVPKTPRIGDWRIYAELVQRPRPKRGAMLMNRMSLDTIDGEVSTVTFSRARD